MNNLGLPVKDLSKPPIDGNTGVVKRRSRKAFYGIIVGVSLAAGIGSGAIAYSIMNPGWNPAVDFEALVPSREHNEDVIPREAVEDHFGKLIMKDLKVDVPLAVVYPVKDSLYIPDPPLVGYYADSAKLGEQGVAILAGHVNTITGEDTALVGLKDVKVGSKFEVVREDKSYSLEVVSIEEYPLGELPVEMFDATGEARLAIVTCGGDVVEKDGTSVFSKNVVVMAKYI